jgi:DNA-binding beta-propeller fold protein YncE
MYVVGASGDDVNEYDLSTAWDISTASYLRNFSVAAQEIIPTGISFKPDGTKMYVVGASGDDVNEYDLSTAWNVSTASYLQNFSVAAQEIAPQGIFFKPDGTKMYVTGTVGDDVNEYDLSTAWNVSTASYLQNFSVAAQEISPEGIFFKPDGTKMYVVGADGDDVNEYDLSTAWDVTSASYLQNFSVASQETSPSGIFFKPDGTKMYVIGYAGDAVFQYTTGVVTNTPITYPASVTFESGSPPAAPAIGAVNTIDLYTVDGGTNYYDRV